MEIDEKELLALVAAKLGTGPVSIATPVKPSPPKPDERKGPRPVESIPVPGTPWSVVFTNDGRRFFFDATNKKSIWKIPPELKDSPVVMKIMENPPWKKSRENLYYDDIFVYFCRKSRRTRGTIYEKNEVRWFYSCTKYSNSVF